MKKVINKGGVVLIYVLFLMSIGVAMGLVVFKNSFVYYNNLEYQDILENLHSNIYTKTDVAFKLVKTYNGNGGGYTDVISCPGASNTITMSGDTLKTTGMLTDIHYLDGVVYCTSSGSTHGGSGFSLFFNKAHDNFEIAEFKLNYVTLTGSAPMQGETTFTGADTDNTLISFSNASLSGVDLLDDNFNSDDYKVVSTGSSSTGTLYPDGFLDDDVFPRRMMFGYLNPSTKFRNIFWNNEEINNFIDANTNNNDGFFEKIGNVNTGYIILTIDGTYDLKIAKYIRSIYSDNGILEPLEILNGASLTGKGYIQNNAGVLSATGSITGNEYVFDFSVYDYALFLRNSGTNDLSYNIMGETSSGTGIYISPIDDSGEGLRYLGNDIYIDLEGKFSPAQFIVTGEK